MTSFTKREIAIAGILVPVLVAVLCIAGSPAAMAQNSPRNPGTPAGEAQGSFEVASVKRLPDRVSPELLARIGAGCDGGFPRVEHNRFTVTTTLYALTTWAYGLNKYNGCSYASFAGLLSGGP